MKFEVPKLQTKKPKKVIEKKNIPPSFMNHILSLGFNENDALVLYENKEDWMGLTSGNGQHRLIFRFKCSQAFLLTIL